MYKIITTLFIIMSSALSQVAPNILPYSSNNKRLNTHQMEYFNNKSIDFFKYAALTKIDDVEVFRLSLSFKEFKTGKIKISNWDIPKGGALFIFNDSTSFIGPYMDNSPSIFVSGLFFSDKVTLEYIRPIDANFIESFIINDIIFNKNDYNDFSEDNFDRYKIINNRELPKIMITGYWPPTNEMVRHFSQNIDLNPNGWDGGNWEGLGYDIVSFFPEFDPPNCNSCGQGFGDLEVDYQDFSRDFWTIISSVNPVAIITFSRGFNDMSWELENRVVNRTNWYDDYTSPFLPTPNPPDNTVDNYHIRYSSLPINEIIDAITNLDLGLNVYLDNTNAGLFLSEFAGYHGVWYKEIYEQDSSIPCFSAGHIHVGAQIDWGLAKEATEITIRTLAEYLDQFIILQGDCNNDGQINNQDLVTVVLSIVNNSQTENSSDLNFDSSVDIFDLLLLSDYLLDL